MTIPISPAEEYYATCKPVGSAILCYATLWHPHCVLSPVWVGYPALWCAEHHAMVHMDLVGTHVEVTLG